jgi:hypothetical protein
MTWLEILGTIFLLQVVAALLVSLWCLVAEREEDDYQ